MININETKKYQDQLKNCPFCGKKPIVGIEFTPDERNLHVIQCDECNINFSQLWTYDNIIEKWNTRSEESNG